MEMHVPSPTAAHSEESVQGHAAPGHFAVGRSPRPGVQAEFPQVLSALWN